MRQNFKDYGTFLLFLRIHYLARHLVSVCFVHLVDCEWQDYDITLLSELQLPEFLLQSAISECVGWVVGM